MSSERGLSGQAIQPAADLLDAGIAGQDGEDRAGRTTPHQIHGAVHGLGVHTARLDEAGQAGEDFVDDLFQGAVGEGCAGPQPGGFLGALITDDYRLIEFARHLALAQLDRELAIHDLRFAHPLAAHPLGLEIHHNLARFVAAL